MSDKSWMLNPKAIRCAKECITIVKKELDIKLTLSHPDFVYLLHEYVDMLDSRELHDAYTRLISLAGPGTVMASLRPKENGSESNVISMPKAVGAEAPPILDDEVDAAETITVQGRVFPKWQDGKQFRGLYRGQPTYR